MSQSRTHGVNRTSRDLHRNRAEVIRVSVWGHVCTSLAACRERAHWAISLCLISVLCERCYLIVELGFCHRSCFAHVSVVCMCLCCTWQPLCSGVRLRVERVPVRAQVTLVLPCRPRSSCCLAECVMANSSTTPGCMIRVRC